MVKGCTNKPTPRSETAILISNIFSGIGKADEPGNAGCEPADKDEIFLMAWIVRQLNTTAVQPRTPLRTQITM